MFLAVSFRDSPSVNGIPWDQGQISIKLGRKHVMFQKVSKFTCKKISLLTGLKLSPVSVYFTDQNMQRGDPMELNCEVFEMQK